MRHNHIITILCYDDLLIFITFYIILFLGEVAKILFINGIFSQFSFIFEYFKFQC